VASPSLYFLYTPPLAGVDFTKTNRKRKERDERDKKTGAKGHVGLHNSVGKRGTYTHNGVSSYTQFPYISQEVNASCMYRVEAYILYYTCCCLSLICWGRATQWRGDNST
jgi:hypothetical protein